jgi:hypothetical protein
MVFEWGLYVLLDDTRNGTSRDMLNESNHGCFVQLL